MWDPFQREILTALGHAPWVKVNPLLPDDRLLHALLRTVHMTPTSTDAAALAEQLPPLSQLRGDAAAKRRLWPRLRRMRGRPQAHQPP